MSRYFQSKGQAFEQPAVEVDIGPVEEDWYSQQARLLLLAPRLRRENVSLQALLTNQVDQEDKKAKKQKDKNKIFNSSWDRDFWPAINSDTYNESLVLGSTKIWKALSDGMIPDLQLVFREFSGWLK